MKRRQFLQALGVGAGLGVVASRASGASQARPRVVVVGAGYGGATAARYLSLWSAGSIDITLVEPNPFFMPSP